MMKQLKHRVAGWKRHCVAALAGPALIACSTAGAQAQTYAPYVTNPFNMSGASDFVSPVLVDLDNDNDLDLVYGSSAGGWGASFTYSENVGTRTSPNFAPGILDAFGTTYIGGILSPTFVDLDNDGDMDMMSGVQGGSLYYYENTGTASSWAFAVPVEDPFGLYSIGYLSTPAFTDIDNDGDQDLLVGEYYGGMYYFPNNGTASAPVFGPHQTLPFGLTNLGFRPRPAFIDMDGDNDRDVLLGVENGNHYYFQNTGTVSVPAFAAAVLNPFGLSATPNVYCAPTFGDLDFDGDLDILSGENTPNLRYFQNTSPIAPPVNPLSITREADARICHGTSAVLRAKGSVYGTLGWYDAPAAGNWLGGGPSFTTPELTATTTFYVQDSTGGGASPSRVAIQVIVGPGFTEQTLTAPNGATYCDSAGVVLGMATEPGAMYLLRDNSNDSIVSGPVITASPTIYMSPGYIHETTTYNMLVQKEMVRPNNEIDFDGVDDKIVVPEGINLANQSFTVEFWAKHDGTGLYEYIIGQHSSYGQNDALQIGFADSENFIFTFFGNHLITNVGVGNGYHHWACVYKADVSGEPNRFIYLDGFLLASDEASGHYTGSGPLMIGVNSFPGSTDFFDGKLDEVRIWNTARTQDEIQEYRNGCLAGDEAGLLAYYSMNDTTSTIIVDQSANGHNGMLINAGAGDWAGTGIMTSCSYVCSYEMASTITITVNQPATATVTHNVCYGSDFTYADGTVATEVAADESHVSDLTTSGGCDSTLTEHIVVLPQFTSDVTTTICAEEEIMVNGTTYNAANPSGTEVFTAVNGCDSTVTIALNVLPALTGTYTGTICAEEEIVINGTTYSAANPSGTEVFTAVNGCDSTVTITLNVLPALTGSYTGTICAEEEIVINGTTYSAANPSGTEVLTAVNGCDSTVTIALNVLPALTGTYAATICPSEELVINGTAYNASNLTGTEVFTAINGCDSTVAVTLTLSELSTLVGFTAMEPWILIADQADATYEWIDCATNQPIAGETGQTFTSTQNGTYGLIVTKDNCTDTSGCITISTLGLENLNGSLLSLYPNPAGSSFAVSGLETLSGVAAISLLDNSGKQIRLLDRTATSWDISAVEAGMYYVRILHDKGTETIKLIKR